MFGIGMPELILILAVALIIFGPKKLPELARSLGKAISEFKNATQDFKDSMDDEIKDVKKPFDDVARDVSRLENSNATGKDDELHNLSGNRKTGTEGIKSSTGRQNADENHGAEDIKNRPGGHSPDE